MNILTQVKNALTAPLCKFCDARKTLIFKGKNYCPNCEGVEVENKILKEM